MKFIGKVLFPQLPPWQSHRQVKHILAALIVAIILGCAVVAIMFLQNGRR
jgi:subtilase family serine protease